MCVYSSATPFLSPVSPLRHSRCLTIRKSACCVRGTNSSTLGRKRAAARRIGEREWTETVPGTRPHSLLHRGCPYSGFKREIIACRGTSFMRKLPPH